MKSVVALLTATAIALAPMAQAAEPMQSRPNAKGCHHEAFIETAITVAAIAWVAAFVGSVLYKAGQISAEVDAAEKKYGGPVKQVCEYKPDTEAKK